MLLLQSFSGHEDISRLFEFDLHLLSEDYEINFDEIIGQNVTIRLDLPDGGKRYWNGFINRFRKSGSTSPQFAQYRATMVPWLWFLTQTSDCRIFQEKTVPDIVRQVFSDLGFTDIEERLSGRYRTWTYCVQYRETDFNFVSRLMEQEGIYYYFLHQNGKCILVLCDSLSLHDPFADYEEIGYARGATSDQERITSWTVEKALHSGKFAHTDFNFEKPGTSLMSPESEQRAYSKADYEVYDYPGEYSEKTDGELYAKVRMEELARSYEVCSGESDARGICPGHLFTMTVRDNTDRSLKDQAREYLVVSASYQASAEDYETSGGTDDAFGCFFNAIPSSIQFRPARISPKPLVEGSQTAIVTGPSGEEIYTDKHGRVKVQFHWDREGKHDENSSCWIRVSQAWAGAGWGAMYIPRIGHEVIVHFIEGDPDRPIITGRVYHGTNMPPYALPGEKTKSTLKSNSTLGGGGSNEFRFEDKKGEEEIYLHGQKDWTIAIENDKNQTIGHNETLHVGVDKSDSIGSNKSIIVGANHTESIGANMSLTVGTNKSETVSIASVETVGAAKALTIGAGYQISVGAVMNETVGGAKMEEIGAYRMESIGGEKTEKIGGGKSVSTGKDYSIAVGKNMGIAVKEKASLSAEDDIGIGTQKKLIISAKESILIQSEKDITLKAGNAQVVLKKDGTVEIKGKKINIKGSGDVKIKGSKVGIN